MALKPLLPTTNLATCCGCGEYVKTSDDACPHCGAGLGGRSGLLARAAGVAIVAGVMLSACGEAQAVYGVPTSEPEPSSTGGESTGDTPTTSGSETVGMTEDATGDATGDASTTDASTTDASTTDASTGTSDTGETTTTEGSSSGGDQPEYGVPDTRGEPDYGVPDTDTDA